MNILYLSCHETLEYYDVQNLRDLGFNVFTVGHNSFPDSNKLYRQLEPNDPELQAKFEYFYKHNKIIFPEGVGNSVQLNAEFVNQFDIILNAFWMQNFQFNLALFRHKINIYRTIAYFSIGNERLLKNYRLANNIKIIRLSPMEKHIKEYAGEDAIIRGSIDSNYYEEWSGENQNILTVHKMMDVCNSRMKPEYEAITTEFFDKRILCGRMNTSIRGSKGELPEIEVNRLRQQSRVYLALCSKQAPLVYSFSEALMAGMPVVTFSKQMIGYDWFEHPDFIENGSSGFYGNSIGEIQSQIQTLLDDYDLAKSMSKEARLTALKHFSTDTAKQKWRDFFKNSLNIDVL